MGDQMDYNVCRDKDNLTGIGWIKGCYTGGYPTSFVIDQRGNIAAIVPGFAGNLDHLNTIINELKSNSFDYEASKKKAMLFQVNNKMLAEVQAKKWDSAMATMEYADAIMPSADQRYARYYLMEQLSAGFFAERKFDGAIKVQRAL